MAREVSADLATMKGCSRALSSSPWKPGTAMPLGVASVSMSSKACFSPVTERRRISSSIALS